MLNIEKMNTASNMFAATVRSVGGLTDEEIARVIAVTFPKSMRLVFEKHDELVRKEKEMNEVKKADKVDEVTQQILDGLKELKDVPDDEKFLGIKVAFMFAEAAADAEQLKKLIEVKRNVLKGLRSDS